MARTLGRLIAICFLAAVVASGCAGNSEPASSLLSPADGATLIADPPAELVILDVRTPEEFAEGHIEGAIQIDFYDEDFSVQIGQLDPDVPYFVYCRSGNRSGQTLAIMDHYGFKNAKDLDGGILAWTQAGLGVVDS